MQTHIFGSDLAHDRSWNTLAWLGVALQAAALVFVLLSQRWGGAWSIQIFLILSVVFLLLDERLPKLISFIVVVASIINAGGWAWNWYDRFVWFDEFIHTFSSFTLMSAMGAVAWTRGWGNAVPGTGRFVVWSAVVGLGLGILWEIAESLFLNLRVLDTIVDLVVDTIGAALAGWFLGALKPQTLSDFIQRQQSPRGAHGSRG